MTTLQQAIDDERETLRGPRCIFAKMVERGQLSAGDLDLLANAHKSGMTFNALVRAFTTATGVRVATTTLSRHVRGLCLCGR